MQYYLQTILDTHTQETTLRLCLRSFAIHFSSLSLSLTSTIRPINTSGTTLTFAVALPYNPNSLTG